MRDHKNGFRGILGLGLGIAGAALRVSDDVSNRELGNLILAGVLLAPIVVQPQVSTDG